MKKICISPGNFTETQNFTIWNITNSNLIMSINLNRNNVSMDSWFNFYRDFSFFCSFVLTCKHLVLILLILNKSLQTICPKVYLSLLFNLFLCTFSTITFPQSEIHVMIIRCQLSLIR